MRAPVSDLGALAVVCVVFCLIGLVVWLIKNPRAGR